MSGERILVDTSALVDFVKGVDAVATAMTGQEVQISIITEIEFLSWPGLSEERIPEARAFLNEYTSNGIGDFIRDYSAWLKRGYKLKLPDAVIAATAKNLNVPLLTRDKGFNKIAHLIEVRLI